MARNDVTMAQIAAAAGVSVPTVSKVLNRRRGVSAETRRAVERALESGAYQRRGRRGRSAVGIVDLVIEGTASQWAMTILDGAYAEADDLGIDLIITSSHGEPVGNPAWLKRLEARGSDGLVLVVSELSPAAQAELGPRDYPVVLVDPVGSGDPDLPTISATNWAGGLAATDHLVGLGHRRIGLITGPEWDLCSHDRLDGYSAALRRAGLDMDPDLVRHGNSMADGGIKHGGALLDLPDRPTAIFSCSDEQAYGIYEAARARGLRIPEDLSVVGFDDVALCRWVSPQLTTIRQPLADMARMAVRIVRDLALGNARPLQRYELATSLVVRDSTAPPSTH